MPYKNSNVEIISPQDKDQEVDYQDPSTPEESRSADIESSSSNSGSIEIREPRSPR